jgi:hypothetical protein
MIAPKRSTLFRINADDTCTSPTKKIMLRNRQTSRKTCKVPTRGVKSSFDSPSPRAIMRADCAIRAEGGVWHRPSRQRGRHLVGGVCSCGRRTRRTAAAAATATRKEICQRTRKRKKRPRCGANGQQEPMRCHPVPCC